MPITSQELNSVLHEYQALRPRTTELTEHEFVLKVRSWSPLLIAFTLVFAVPFGFMGVALAVAAVVGKDEQDRLALGLTGLGIVAFTIGIGFLVRRQRQVRLVFDLRNGDVLKKRPNRAKTVANLATVTSYRQHIVRVNGIVSARSLQLETMVQGRKKLESLWISVWQLPSKKAWDQLEPAIGALITYFHQNPVASVQPSQHRNGPTSAPATPRYTGS